MHNLAAGAGASILIRRQQALTAEKSKQQQRRVELADGKEQAQRLWECTQAELEQDGAIQPAVHRAAEAHVQRAAAPRHPGHHVSPIFHLTVM